MSCRLMVCLVPIKSINTVSTRRCEERSNELSWSPRPPPAWSAPLGSGDAVGGAGGGGGGGIDRLQLQQQSGGKQQQVRGRFKGTPVASPNRAVAKMTRTFLCEYCDRSFPDTPSGRKKHRLNAHHKKLVQQHYESATRRMVAHAQPAANATLELPFALPKGMTVASLPRSLQPPPVSGYPQAAFSAEWG